MKCTVTNISNVHQTVFPVDMAPQSIARGVSFTGDFTPDRVDEMQHRQPGKFSVATEAEPVIDEPEVAVAPEEIMAEWIALSEARLEEPEPEPAIEDVIEPEPVAEEQPAPRVMFDDVVGDYVRIDDLIAQPPVAPEPPPVAPVPAPLPKPQHRQNRRGRH